MRYLRKCKAHHPQPESHKLENTTAKPNNTGLPHVQFSCIEHYGVGAL